MISTAHLQIIFTFLVSWQNLKKNSVKYNALDLISHIILEKKYCLFCYNFDSLADVEENYRKFLRFQENQVDLLTIFCQPKYLQVWWTASYGSKDEGN